MIGGAWGNFHDFPDISGGRSLVRARFIATEQEERDLIARFLRKKQQATITPEEARK